MLTHEENELLCRVGPDTPMGQVLRRYWLPALTTEELPEPDCPPVRVKLLGEELVAFRDTTGAVALVDNYCPHRRASLFFGRNEEAGIRCVYHGWKFDVHGDCVDMPSEPAESNFKDKVNIKAYPCVDKGGTIWAYMGPQEIQPPFLNFPALQLPDSHLITNRVLSDCNFIQSMEGNLDTSHISYLHRNLADLKMDDFDDGTDAIGFPSPRMSTKIRGYTRDAKLMVQPTSYGWRYVGLRDTPNGHHHLRITTAIFPIYQMIARLPSQGPGILMMVPRDDETCWRWSVGARTDRPFTDEEREQRRLEAANLTDIHGRGEKGKWNDYMMSREDQRTLSYTGIKGIGTQDQAVTESMQPISDKVNEHLGTSDRAIIYNRRVLLNAARAMLEGQEPLRHNPDVLARVTSHEEIIPAGDDWRNYGAFAGEADGLKV